MTPLRAPFPWFGGKRRVAEEVWERFGDVANYVEPFAGSLAVLLARPHAPKVETVNDRDGYLVNFWRAVQAQPDAVWAYADQPVFEADLHARHVWLIAQSEFRERILSDPHYYDVKIAGWWVWGLSLWIGDGWCAPCTDRPTDRPTDKATPCHHAKRAARRPVRKIPELGVNRGVRRDSFQNSGVGAEFAPSVRPSVRPFQPDSCRTSAAQEWAFTPREHGGVFDDLAERLRDVRIACGDWSRVVTPSVTWRHGVTGVFLDPPYDDGEHAIAYSGGGHISANVRAWAIANGNNPELRIALCGYEGEHVMPDGWSELAWKAQGGYGSQGDGRGRANRSRERVWFSPHCEAASQSLLFEVSA